LIGFFANNATNRPVPDGLFAEFNTKTNLVYYDWEITGSQVNSWTQMGQLLRLVFGRRQLPPATASLPWLRGYHADAPQCHDSADTGNPGWDFAKAFINLRIDGSGTAPLGGVARVSRLSRWIAQFAGDAGHPCTHARRQFPAATI